MTTSPRTITVKATIALMAASAIFLFAMPVMTQAAVSTGLEATRRATELPRATIDDRVTGALTAVMGLVGVAFLVLMIYGGFLWMTAAGEPKRVETAKGVIVSAVIGIVLVFAAYAITDAVFTAISPPPEFQPEMEFSPTNVGPDPGGNRADCMADGGEWYGTDPGGCVWPP